MKDLKTPVILTALSAIGDFRLKDYSLAGDNYDLLKGAACYMGVVAVLANKLGEAGVAYTNNMWNAGTSILETIMAYQRGEKLSNLNIFGIVLVIIGSVLLNVQPTSL